MAEGMEAAPAVRALSDFQRLNWRRIAQWAVGIATLTFVLVGSWRTLQSGQISGTAWRDLIRDGVARGLVYGLIAIGYTMVYGVLRMVNFAHGEVFMAGAFGSYFVARTMSNSGFLNANPVIALLILLLVASLVSIGVAVLLERVAYRPLRSAPRLVPLITAIGASLFLQNTALGFFGAQARGYPRPEVLEGSWTVLGVPLQRVQVLIFLVTLVAMVGLTLFIRRTKTGRAMRAVAQDREIAALMGIDVDRVIVITFAVGGLMAGVAAVLFTQYIEIVSPFIGFQLGIKAFSAAVLGGIGSITGAVLGGLLLGVLEAVGPNLFLTGYHVAGPNQLKDVVAFAILVLVLIFRPSGILGSDDADKV